MLKIVFSPFTPDGDTIKTKNDFLLEKAEALIQAAIRLREWNAEEYASNKKLEREFDEALEDYRKNGGKI